MIQARGVALNQGPLVEMTASQHNIDVNHQTIAMFWTQSGFIKAFSCTRPNITKVYPQKQFKNKTNSYPEALSLDDDDDDGDDDDDEEVAEQAEFLLERSSTPSVAGEKNVFT